MLRHTDPAACMEGKISHRLYHASIMHLLTHARNWNRPCGDYNLCCDALAWRQAVRVAH